MKVKGAARLTGIVRLPGDKSISHRAAMFAAIAEGTSRISRFAASQDCLSTLSCLETLGVRVNRDGSDVEITGRGKRGLSAPAADLDCGNSGTTMRLLSGILSGQPFTSTLTGDASLSRRPMNRIIEPLTQMGSTIVSNDGFPPLSITGRTPLRAIEFTSPVASAQLKSCVVLAGLYSDGVTSVVEPVPTRDHTERMLRAFGVDIETSETEKGRSISVEGDRVLTATDVLVPSDISSAVFLLVAAACLDGSHVEMPNVGINPTRSAVVDVLRRFGARIEVTEVSESGGEPFGTLTVTGGIELERSDTVNRIDGPIIASLIDEIPALAVFGTQLDGGLEVRNAGELRVKESDRIKSTVENLRRMNADVEEFDDGFLVRRSSLKGAHVDSLGDHRIAMAFAVAGLLAEGETEIRGAECADVSFPGFFGVLSKVAVR